MAQHEPRAADACREAPCPPPQAPRRTLSRGERLGVAALGLISALVLGAWLTWDNATWWGQPDVTVTVTGERPDGGLRDGTGSCDASVFQVVSRSGRTGSFRACSAVHAAGDRVTARWDPDGSDGLRLDTVPPAEVAVSSAVLGLAVAGLALLAVRSEHRYEERRRSAG